MAKKYVDMRTLEFLLYEVFQVEELTRYEYYQDYDREAGKMALQTAMDIGDKHLFPYYTILDKEKATCENGQVWTHPKLKEGLQAISQGGWIAAHFPFDVGGQQMPNVLLNAAQVIWYAANANITSHAFLTQGTANLVYNFANDELKSIYLDKLLTGEWQGTMALTEPQAGSSLSDITSSATPTEEGHFLINGQKIYISGGDHLAVDNVVHLMLARIDGSPQGTKGISLFVVPKFRPEGEQLVANDVSTAGIYGKMGQKGYVAAHLMYGEKNECRGYLVGQPNMGLNYMFQMMNEARVGTGLLATGVASAAYQAALQYAQERPQGRLPSQKNKLGPQVPIIEHADVKRMLLYQKAIVEGSMSLLMYCSKLSDISEQGAEEEKAEAHTMLSLLTPIAKSFPAEWGNHAVSNAMQCFGGAGYTDDFPVEQMFRDIRVNSIYEGTTGIHGLDLLGRKVMGHGGAAFKMFMEKIQDEAKAAESDVCKQMSQQLLQAAKSLHEVTLHLGGLAAENKPEVFLADATIYLEYFATVCVAWQWLIMANKATLQLDSTKAESEVDFYHGKIATAQFFFTYELPKIKAKHTTLVAKENITLNITKAQF